MVVDCVVVETFGVLSDKAFAVARVRGHVAQVELLCGHDELLFHLIQVVSVGIPVRFFLC